jgi:SnoaL-like domain
MKKPLLLLLISAPLVGGAVLAHEAHQGAAQACQLDVPDSAQGAAATVDRFFAALSAGNLEQAGQELDPGVIVLESGGAEHSAAEYLGGHAKDDAEFLKAAHYQPSRRTARASADLAWVASEGEMHTRKDGTPLAISSTETMVLKSTPAGWKIIHIHWSSRTRKP